MFSGRVGSFCTTSGIGRVTLVTQLMISHECGKGRIVITTNEPYLWSFVPSAYIYFGFIRIQKWILSLETSTKIKYFSVRVLD